MKEFYETELEESVEKDEEAKDMEKGKYQPVGLNLDEKSGLQKRQHTRGMKKAPGEKAKEKLWESIVSQTNNDGGTSSSDEEKV